MHRFLRDGRKGFPKMRKLHILVVIVLISLLLTGVTYVGATEVESNLGIDVSDEECLIIKNNLDSRDLGGKNLVCSVLFDAKNVPAFLLGTTEKGFIILDRDSYSFHEGGEGNPYNEYMSEKKYYGGPFLYYVDAASANTHTHKPSSAIYFNIERNQYSENIATAMSRVFEKVSPAVLSDNKRGVLGETHFLYNYYNYIRWRSFGINQSNSSYVNTCSAVALGIAMNYLFIEAGMGMRITKEFLPMELITSIECIQ
jgi:hypothetical protein